MLQWMGNFDARIPFEEKLGELNVYKADCFCGDRQTGSKIILKYNDRGDPLQARDDYFMPYFIHQPDSIKLKIVERLLAFENDSSQCCMGIGIYLFNDIPVRRGVPDRATSYNLQVDALFMINRICWPTTIDRHSAVPVVFDRHTMQSVNDDPQKIKVLFQEYKDWFRAARAKGTIGAEFPFNIGRYVWYLGSNSQGEIPGPLNLQRMSPHI